jgi:urease accessory protein
VRALRALDAGQGLVEVAPGGAVTRLAARSPLHLIPTRNHGRAAWVVATSLGGGLVDGDRLRLDVQVLPDAACLLATQASTKVYPERAAAAGAGAAQELEATVATGGLFVSLPDPVVCYAGARYGQAARVRLEAGASLVWLEALAAGRTARGERWAFERFESRLSIDGAAALEDATLLDATHGPLAPRLGRFDALATLVAVGPHTTDLRAAWLAADPSPLRRGAPVRVAPGLAAAGQAVVVRLAAESVHALLDALRPLLAPVATLLGDDPLSRRP